MKFEEQLFPGFADEPKERKSSSEPDKPRGFVNITDSTQASTNSGSTSLKFFQRERPGYVEDCPECEKFGSLGCMRHRR